MEGPIKRRPLKDKLREHWQARDEIWNPKPEKANKMGRIFTWVYACSSLYFVLWVVLPNIEEIAVSSHSWIWRAIAWYLFFNIIFNWCLLSDLTFSKATSDHVKQVCGDIDPANLPDGWKPCPLCQISVPPRSHHCKVCNICILKREHHCFFTGRCVGWANQRRFLPFLFHTLAGTIYAMILIITYLTGSQQPWSRLWYNYVPGVSLVQWIFGDLPSGHFILLLELYISCIVMFASGAFLVWELAVVLRGQTTYELARGIETYSTTGLRGFRAVFGSYGLLHFLFPMPLHLENDGVHWPLHKNTKTS